MIILIRGSLLFIEAFLAFKWINDSQGNYEPYIILVGIIWAAIEFFKNKITFTSSDSLTSPDCKTFEEFQKDLPSTGTIDFLRKNNIAGFPFESDRLNEIARFQNKWSSPSYSFQDKTLDNKKNSLLKAINHYFTSINSHTVPQATSGWLSVPQDLELTDPDKFKASVDDLYLKADVVIKLYDEIIKYGRNKIA